MMDSRILDPPHAQFGGSLGGMVGFPYHLSHHHVYELAGHQLQSASAVPFSIDGLLNGSCTASVGNSNPLLSSGCGMNGDNQQYKLSGKPHYVLHNRQTSPQGWLVASRQKQKETKAGYCDTSYRLGAERAVQTARAEEKRSHHFHHGKLTMRASKKKNNVPVSQ